MIAIQVQSPRTTALCLYQLALEHLASREVDAAITFFNRAQRAGYHVSECAAGRWICHMLAGHFERAWRESDFIANSGFPDPNRFWDGTRFNGKRVILRCLHGYGDAIQFIRYAPMIRREAVSLVVETHPEMITALRGAAGVDEVISWGEQAPRTPPRWDQQIEIMELPRAFKTTIKTIPRQIPYIFAGPTRMEQSRRYLGNPRKPKIGIVWASSNYNPARSVPFQQILQLLSDARFAYYSLQHGPERKHLHTAGSPHLISDTVDHSPEIADTAADIANLDLIITVDTVTAHLAGAMGRPVWTLLPYDADWRWMLERTDSPWYPTMRLFRQKIRGEWCTAIDEVKHALEQFP